MQQDDAANPAMLWVAEGAAKWSERPALDARSCADCHGDATVSMRGVAARYPMFDVQSGSVLDLQGRINQCRTARQSAPALAHESDLLLALVSYVALQSRGLPITPPEDPRLDIPRERGRQFFLRRQGHLDLACANCHDDNWGRKLGGSTVPQAHPAGYPIYRLEWQTMGSVQRRFRNCLTGIRAEPYEFGAPEYVELELYLMWRARGMPMESPGVRP